MTATVYRVPPRFYNDHIARDCGQSGVVLKETTRYVEVLLDSAAADDLRSDADYYVHEGVGSNGLDREFLGLVASAAATLRALEKGRPATDADLSRADEARRETAAAARRYAAAMAAADEAWALRAARASIANRAYVGDRYRIVT